MKNQKEKSLSLVKEIEEALISSKNLNLNSPDFPLRNEQAISSFTGYKQDKSNEKDLKDQINGSFKKLAIQTINTLTSLKSNSGNKKEEKIKDYKGEIEKSQKTDKTPINLKKKILFDKKEVFF